LDLASIDHTRWRDFYPWNESVLVEIDALVLIVPGVINFRHVFAILIVIVEILNVFLQKFGEEHPAVHHQIATNTPHQHKHEYEFCALHYTSHFVSVKLILIVRSGLHDHYIHQSEE